jgi:sigma-B regulation protein RsbU (phosphoserine phosphatase)
MKVLIAEDDPISSRLLAATLTTFGFEVVCAVNGAEAWAILQSVDSPSLAILDWMMPELQGVEVCRRVRQIPTATPPYLILLTAKSEKSDVVIGLDSGADDYLTKPFDRSELHARIRVGTHVLELQKHLVDRVQELEAALSQVKQLQGLLPVCSYCKKVRSEENYWQRVENYLAEHADVVFTHGICPDCYRTVVQPQLDQRNVSLDAPVALETLK